MNLKDSKLICSFILLNFLFFSCFAADNLPCPPKSTIPPSSSPQKCPKDTLKFGVCGSWLGLVKEVIGTKPSEECCILLKGLADLEAALCLCTAIKANVLGAVKVKVHVAVSLLVNACGKKVPSGFVRALK